MKQTWHSMGMPINLIIEDEGVSEKIFKTVRDYFQYVDEKYSPYKSDSEVSKINNGLKPGQWSREMKTVWELCQDTKKQTKGYFDAMHQGKFDPSGLVKGWAIQNAARLLRKLGFKNFYLEAGGDIQVDGKNEQGRPWSIGIRNPFNRHQNVKVVNLTNKGIATSGTAVRGQHIYNPHEQGRLSDVASISVIGPNIYEADRFATAAFAMGRRGIEFIESLPGFEAYMITADQQATLTSGFEAYAGGV